MYWVCMARSSVRSYQKLPPCLIETMPASSKVAKAELISNSARSSGITCLRMEKITVSEPLEPEKEVRISGSHVEAVWEGLLL